jgi:hypothetical protein
MTFSSQSDPSADPLFALKGEARRLRSHAQAEGQELTHSAALEQVARRNGFRSWNALSAHVAEGGRVDNTVAQVYCWQRLDEPLPALPMRIIQASQRSRHSNITELMRWARQMELVATKVAEEYRSEMVDLIGGRVPYVLEMSKSRWPDGQFHLCDRGYEEFKGIALSQAQVDALGLEAWNDTYGSHDGGNTFTLVGDDWRHTRKAEMLKRMARLLAAFAVETDKTFHATNAGSVPSSVAVSED